MLLTMRDLADVLSKARLRGFERDDGPFPAYAVLLATKRDGLVPDICAGFSELDATSGRLLHVVAPYPASVSDAEVPLDWDMDRLVSHAELMKRCDLRGQVVGDDTLDDFADRYGAQSIQAARHLGLDLQGLPYLVFCRAVGAYGEDVAWKLRRSEGVEGVVDVVRRVSDALGYIDGLQLEHECFRRRTDLENLEAKLAATEQRLPKIRARLADDASDRLRKHLEIQIEENERRRASLSPRVAELRSSLETLESQWHEVSRAAAMEAVKSAFAAERRARFLGAASETIWEWVKRKAPFPEFNS